MGGPLGPQEILERPLAANSSFFLTEKYPISREYGNSEHNPLLVVGTGLLQKGDIIIIILSIVATVTVVDYVWSLPFSVGSSEYVVP